MSTDVVYEGRQMALDRAIVVIVKKCRKKPFRYRDGNHKFLNKKGKPPQDFKS